MRWLQFFDRGAGFAFNCRPMFPLQKNFDEFLRNMRAAGLTPQPDKIGLYAVDFVRYARVSIDPLQYVESACGNKEYLRLDPNSLTAVIWTPGLDYSPMPLVNPQYPATKSTDSVTLAMIGDAIRAQSLTQEQADALIKLIQERTTA